jgi:hypothetical protein
VFHVNSLRPRPTPTLRLRVLVATPKDYDEYDVYYICVVEIETVAGHRGKRMMFYTHFNDEHIPPLWHRLN